MTTSRLLPTPQASDSIDVIRDVEWRGNSPRIKSNQGVDGQAKIAEVINAISVGNNPMKKQSTQLPLFSQEAFPVSPFPVPGNEKARKMTVTSGRKCLESYQKQGPLGLLAKMLVGSSTWDSMTVFLTWKLKATKRNRLYYQLVPKTPRTDGTGSGLLLSSPTCADSTTVYQSQKALDAGWMPRLNEQIAMLPTPTETDYKSRGPNSKQVGIDNLFKGTNRGANRGLKLQPAFVEWMMGYPIGWTDLNHSETPSSHK